MVSPFTPIPCFLRALRNNDREWFKARRDDYDRHVAAAARDHRTACSRLPEVRAPMSRRRRRLLPDLPRYSVQRRQAAQLKTHAAAVFPWKDGSASGPACISGIAPEVWIGGGMRA